jgi:hypothetical protein
MNNTGNSCNNNKCDFSEFISMECSNNNLNISGIRQN